MARKDIETQEPPAQTRWVKLDRPGVVACGEYKQGVAYEVEAQEAQRLIDHKGFIAVDAPVVGATPAAEEA